MIVALGLLVVAPKAAFAEGETYTVSFTLDGKTEVYSTTYKAGEAIQIPASDDDSRFDDLINRIDEDYNYPWGITDVKDNGGGLITVSDPYALSAEYAILRIGGECTGAIVVHVTWSPIVAQPVMTWSLDVTVKATLNRVNVTYDSNGGEGTLSPNPQAVTKGAFDKLNKNTFTRKGYKFTGWNTAKDGSGTPYNDEESIKIDSDLTLYAQWAPIAYTVAFDANGGDGTMSDQDFDYDEEKALTTCAYTRDGYTFEGWEGSDGNDYTDGQKVKNLTDTDGDTITMTAQWKAIDYSLTVTDDGNGTAKADKANPLHIGDKVGLEATPNTGYVFDEWETVSGSPSISGDELTMPAGNVEVKAKFAPITYTVHYEANGGEGDMLDDTLTYDVEQALTACGFTREGYDFTGWKGSDGNDYADAQSVKNLTDVDGNTITLTAQWAPHHYTVVYAANGGTGSMADQAFVYDEERALTANTFTRDGYTFAGWEGSDGNYYDDAQGVKNLTATDGGVITLSAQWDAIMYTVAFDANGGSGSMDPQSVQALVPTALNANQFTREGYTFVAWNTKADGTGVKIADGINIKVSSDVTLYAQWKKNPEAKPETKKEKAEAKKAETKATPKNAALPKTGDVAPVAATIATALAGAASIVAGARRKRK